MRVGASRPRSVTVRAAAWTKVATKTELSSAPGARKVVEVSGQKVGSDQSH